LKVNLSAGDLPVNRHARERAGVSESASRFVWVIWARIPSLSVVNGR
jgi:hypothetical protein